MPMDIRNFFSSKKGSGGAGGGTKKKQVAPKKAAAPPKKKKAASNSSRNNNTSKAKKKPIDEDDDNDVIVVEEKPKKKTNETKTAKKKAPVLKEDEDYDDAEEEETPKPVPKKSKKRLVIEDSSEEDEGDDDKMLVDDVKKAPPKSKPNNNKRKAVDTNTATSRSAAAKDTENGGDDRKELSVSDFFGGQAQKATKKNKPTKEASPPKKQKSTPPIRDEPDEEEEDSPFEPDDKDDDDDDDYVEEKVTKKSPPKAAATPTSATKRKAPPDESSSSSKTAKKKKSPSTTMTTTKRKAPPPRRDPPLKPTLELDSFDSDAPAASGCLEGYTFVFTGVMDGLNRDEATDFIKILGGRVTGTVSSKTDYLVTGEVLEDGRPVAEGSKYRRALKEKTMLVSGVKELYGLAQQYCDKKSGGGGGGGTSGSNAKPPPAAAAAASVAKAPPPAAAAAAAATVANPYARKANPYAKKSNPYAKKSSAAVSTSASSSALDCKPAAVPPPQKNASGPNDLWVDKYKPTCSREILGNQECVRKLSLWLASWEHRFNGKHAGKTFSSPNGPWKAALLSGPPGIGKTTTATLVAYESGRDVLEFNASDVRSKKAMQEQFGDITGSNTLQFRKTNSSNTKTEARKKRCIIMDEVDGMGAGDRSGMSELIQMIKSSRVPIICICNDRQSQKMKSLLPYCMDLRYRRPVKSVIASRAIEIARMEGLMVERNAAEAIVESCGNDVRQVLNCLQMWASNNKDKTDTMTYKGLKDREHSINKDEILRVSLFDAARTIVEGRKGLAGVDKPSERSHLFKRSDAFFVDYNFVGLLVQQNYLKIMQPQFNEANRQNDHFKMGDVLNRMHDAAQSMSDFALAENCLRGGQNWSLLPTTAMLAVKTGYHAGGETGGMLPGFPEFTTWLGRNSTRGKKRRLVGELGHHMNYHISGGTSEMRMSYLPVLRDRFLNLLLLSEDEGAVEEAVDLMDEYGLDRDDIFEKMDEFKMDSTAPSFQKIDSKKKAAFTRFYNQGSHKSQALVAEQGAAKKPKRKASSVSETKDPDAIDDDHVDEEEEEEEEELDAEKIRAMFKKKGRKKSTNSKSKAKPKAKPKPKKAKK